MQEPSAQPSVIRYFDPKAEIEMIRNTRDRVDRKKRLEEFKILWSQVLRHEQEIREEIEIYLLAHPDASKSDVLTVVNRLHKNSTIPLPLDFPEKVSTAYDFFKERRTMVNSFDVSDPKQAFITTFGIEPVGEIRVEKGTMTINFIVRKGSGDLAQAYYHRKVDDMTNDELTRTFSIDGFYTFPIFVVSIASTITQAGPLEPQTQKVIEHEERHQLNSILNPKEISILTHLSSHNRADWVRNQLNYIHQEVYRSARNELVAYLENSDNTVIAKLSLTSKNQNGDLEYDFYEHMKQYVLSPNFRFPEIYTRENPNDPIAPNEMRKLIADQLGTQEQYNALYEAIEFASEGYKLLRKYGYSHHETLMFLDTEPITRWLSIAKRVIGKDISQISENPAETALLQAQSIALPYATAMVEPFFWEYVYNFIFDLPKNIRSI